MSSVMRGTTSGLAAALAAIVLFVVLGLGLLYAYRSQTPAIQFVPVTTLLTEVQQGRVKSVVIEDGRATATLIDAMQQQAQFPGNGEDLARAIDEHNRADPSHPIDLRYNPSSPGIFGIFPALFTVLLSVLLPVLFIFVVIRFAAYAFARARSPQRYEDLARLADLRDRGVVTEEEFQREKRRILK